jgi:uncharacterized membrane protein
MAMNRHELDALLALHTLSAENITRALTLSGNRPSVAEWRAFAVRSLGLVGMAGVGAGLIFFIAANWQSMSAVGRFALVQVMLLLCVAVAWWKIPNHANKNNSSRGVMPAALMLATLVSGALIALFGQTYQTGADVYELFFFWALLTLPFVLAAMSGALWAIWACIINVGLALYTGWHGPNDFVWAVFDRWGVHKPTMLMLPFVMNLAAAVAVYVAGAKPYAAAFPAWLGRLLLTFAFVYGTAASLFVILPHYSWRFEKPVAAQDCLMLAMFVAACIMVALFAFRHKRDVYPLALIVASFLILSTSFIIVHLLSKDLGGLFLLAMWLITASTTAGFVLMRYVRSWRGNNEVAA